MITILAALKLPPLIATWADGVTLLEGMKDAFILIVAHAGGTFAFMHWQYHHTRAMVKRSRTRKPARRTRSRKTARMYKGLI